MTQWALLLLYFSVLSRTSLYVIFRYLSSVSQSSSYIQQIYSGLYQMNLCSWNCNTSWIKWQKFMAIRWKIIIVKHTFNIQIQLLNNCSIILTNLQSLKQKSSFHSTVKCFYLFVDIPQRGKWGWIHGISYSLLIIHCSSINGKINHKCTAIT